MLIHGFPTASWDWHRIWPTLAARYRLIAPDMTERRTHRERWVGALQNAKIPLRVIDGADDPVSGRHMVERYRELVPNPDTVLLEGIGH